MVLKRRTVQVKGRKVHKSAVKFGKIPRDAPSSTASGRWETLRKLIRRPVQRGTLPGVAARVLVAGEERLLEEFGLADIEARRPMTRRSLVRLYSMTKCVIAAAVMQLVEAKQLSLDDLLSDHIAAFAEVRVAVEGPDGLPVPSRTVPPNQPIRIRHLLTHTSGISCGLAPGLDGPRKRSRKERTWAGIYWPLVRKVDAGELSDLGSWVQELAKLPLIEQPGTHYGYGYSYDVLGHLVELKTGKPLAQVLKERIFAPLGMKDSVFDLSGPRRKLQDRLAVLYRCTKSASFGSNGRSRRLVRVDPARKASPSRWARFCRVPSGGGGLSSLEGGLLSTLDDYSTFLLTVLNGGAHPTTGARIMSKASADAMLADQSSQLRGIRGGPPTVSCRPYDDKGLGLSCLGELQRKGAPSWGRWFDGVEGVRLWGGAASCAFKYDPNNGRPILVVVMTQVLPQDDGGLISDLLKGVREALEEEDK